MRLITLLYLFFVTLIFAATIEISETPLMEYAKKHAPSLDTIKANLLASQTQMNLSEEKFAPEIFGKASYSETQERLLFRQLMPLLKIGWRFY